MHILVGTSSERCDVALGALTLAGYTDLTFIDSVPGLIHLLHLHDHFAAAPPFDAVILETEIEGDVPALCQMIRALERLKEFPILVADLPEARLNAEAVFRAGATDYLSRPLDDAESLARIRRAATLKTLADERRHDERTRQQELTMARRVQRSVLSRPIQQPGIEIDSAYIPSETLSGDMYYWNEIRPNTYGILLADVMGHGLSSSLISMAIRSLMHGLVTRVVEPAAVLRELNRHMQNFQPHYLTALYMVIDTENHTITYANAGHPPAMLLQADGSIVSMGRTCMPLGLLPDIKIQAESTAYAPPARILMYTDGLVEDRGRPLREGIDELKQCLVNHSRETTGQFIASVVLKRNKILAASDDICLIAATLQ